MRVIRNPDKDFVEHMLKALKNNNCYCPCKLEKTEHTKCMCKEFLEQEDGWCHCGLYYKET